MNISEEKNKNNGTISQKATEIANSSTPVTSNAATAIKEKATEIGSEPISPATKAPATTNEKTKSNYNSAEKELNPTSPSESVDFTESIKSTFNNFSSGANSAWASATELARKS